MQKLNETRKDLKRIKLRKVASTMIKKCTNHQSLDLANVELMNQNHLPLKKNKHVSNKKNKHVSNKKNTHVSNKKSKNSWGFKSFWFAKFQKTKSF